MKYGTTCLFFNFKVNGQPTVPVSGNRLSASAKAALAKARAGDLVQISGINAVVPGLPLKSPTSVAIELTD